ncbi:MAG TPA: hypothetical protein VGF48_18295 [Thermoanaerobaculia bacterium]|jgi:hypothetical protein
MTERLQSFMTISFTVDGRSLIVADSSSGLTGTSLVVDSGFASVDSHRLDR